MIKRKVPKPPHLRLAKKGRSELASSLDVNFMTMVHLFDALKAKPGNVQLQTALQTSRVVAIDAVKHMRDEMHPSAHDLLIIERILDRLENHFNKNGVVEAFNVTCGLKKK